MGKQDRKMQAAFLPWDARNKKVKGWIAYDIVWDTAGQPIDLPTTVTIEDESVEFDNVADYLSDKYGWCVYSLGIKPLTEENKKRRRSAVRFPA